MSVAQALSEGLQVTVVGLAIVFSVLIILMLVLMAFKVIFYKPEQSCRKEGGSRTAADSGGSSQADRSGN